MNLSDLLGGGSIPLGAIVTIPSGTATTITMPAGDVLLKTPSASSVLVPTSSCAAQLPAIVNSTNDNTLGGTISTLTGFASLSYLLSCTENSFASTNRQVPKMLYVGSTYYIFNHLSAADTFGFSTFTDNVNWTPAQTISSLARTTNLGASISIVDVYYLAGVWYFLDANAQVFSMTDLVTGAGFTIYPLPITTYKKFAYINSNWYIVGASRTGSGYIILKSANLTSFTISENTSAVAIATSICQGSGTGGTTEILVTCASDNIVKSVDNGATFTLVATPLGVAGYVIKNCMYSATTSKYHLAVSGNSETVVMAVSSGSTLTGATWTKYTSGTGATNMTSTGYINIVDTGTNVGLMFMSNALTYAFYYGATYNTVGTAVITSTDKQIQSDSQLGHGVSYWLNNKIFVFYGNGVGGTNTGSNLFGASGATVSSGITRLLSFYDTSDIWSGLTYLSGSYYTTRIGVTYAAGYNGTIVFLHKFASNLATMSCPVAPYAQTTSSNGTVPKITQGVYDSTGTKILWMTTDFNTSTATNAAFCFTYDGSTLTSTSASAVNPNTVSATNSAMSDSNLSYTNFNTPKWSSLYSKYIYAMPCYAAHATLTTSLIKVTSVATIGGAQTDIFSQAQVNAADPTKIVSCDVLNDGSVVYGYWYASSGTYATVFNVVNPTKLTQIFTANTNIQNIGMWNFAYGGSNYLVFAGTVSSLTSLIIWKLNSTDYATKVFHEVRSGSPYSNMTNGTTFGVSASTGNANLKRTMTSGGDIYLLDGSNAVISSTNKNTLKLTPSGNTFILTMVNLYNTGDAGFTGNTNAYSNNNSLTIADSVLTPTVVIAGTNIPNSYTRIK